MEGIGVDATPFGFDAGPSVFTSEDDLTAFLNNMTAGEPETWPPLDHRACDLDSPIEYLSSAASDSFRSPGKQLQYLPSLHGASSSLSPRDRSTILTPTSSLALHEFVDVLQVEDQPSSESTTSTPESSFSPSSGEYVQVRQDTGRSQGRSHLTLRPQPMPGSGASTFSAQQSHLHNFATNTSHSTSFATTSAATGSWTIDDMDGSGAWGELDPSSYPAQIDTGVPAELATFDASHLGSTPSFNQSTHAYDNGATFRSFGNDVHTFDHASFTPNFDAYALQTPMQMQAVSQSQGASITTRAPTGQATPHFNVMTRQPFANVQQFVPMNSMPPSLSQQTQLTMRDHGQLGFRAGNNVAAPTNSLPSVSQPQRVMVENIHTTVQNQASVQQAIAQRLRNEPTPSQQVPRDHQHDIRGSGPAQSRQLRALPPGSSRMKVDPLQAPRAKGGRKRNEPLTERCPDGNSPCARCVTAFSDGKLVHFPCTRAKLPMFVLDFLPPSMTGMHQKQSIEDYMNAKVSHWHKDTATDIYLTCGHGPALRWKLYEFTPIDDEPCWQWQYLQVNGRSEARQKYSPPFAMIKFDMSDEAHIDEFMDEMLQPRYLADFGWTCFEEETPINDFQAQVLQAMCALYTATHDPDLKDVLRKILRMTALTYIMGHTLTLLETTTFGVLRAMKYAKMPSPSAVPTQHVSPRLANRQLKLFFSLHREKVYKELLNWQQQTLHASKSKEECWLPAFCVTLGLALVLEEVQRTIWVQADAKVKKDETVTQHAAETEAYNACSRIDERFELLGNLFRAKYRAKKWRTAAPGSFGPATPHLPEYEAQNFLNDVYALLVNNQTHLRIRQDVPLSSENQCFYTSRLVARFLLPFLDNPMA
ncbi:hypothetical protein LTR78_002563 [Recurvomyces mirabilis]|uniref:Uncharacterized protein n=1 Tax=Recurvomyces mirabilis TaxID=574656 RepID=A0AAE1C4F0_9PEZI|nr:hypothetical protein LTR78_002563 [Recurvomyces mirabilis]KAK5157492.1 hypothetical protein LTS14_004257 [Recurvomyces mirabilis]